MAIPTCPQPWLLSQLAHLHGLFCHIGHSLAWPGFFFARSRGMCEVMHKSPWAGKKEKRTGHQAETETKNPQQTKQKTHQNLARFVPTGGDETPVQ